jgi:hypothetical protein
VGNCHYFTILSRVQGSFWSNKFLPGHGIRHVYQLAVYRALCTSTVTFSVWEGNWAKQQIRRIRSWHIVGLTILLLLIIYKGRQSSAMLQTLQVFLPCNIGRRITGVARSAIYLLHLEHWTSRFELQPSHDVIPRLFPVFVVLCRQRPLQRADYPCRLAPDIHRSRIIAIRSSMPTHAVAGVCHRIIKQTNSMAFDWATVTCWRNLVPTFVDRGVSRGQHGGYPSVVNLSFLDRSRYFSFK